MTLTEIAAEEQELADLLDLLTNDDGEVDDEIDAAFSALFESIEQRKGEKLDGYVNAIRAFEGFKAACKLEAARYAEKCRAWDNKASWLRRNGTAYYCVNPGNNLNVAPLALLLLLPQRFALDLELHHAPRDLVELRRQRVDLGAQFRRGLVDVDGLPVNVVRSTQRVRDHARTDSAVGKAVDEDEATGVTVADVRVERDRSIETEVAHTDFVEREIGASEIGRPRARGSAASRAAAERAASRSGRREDPAADHAGRAGL